MIFQKQTRDTNCGQTCMAMLMQWSVDLVEITMHCKGKTSYAKLRKFLKDHSRFTLGPTTKIWTDDFRDIDTALLRLTFSPKESHWVITQTPFVYDPAAPTFLLLEDWLKRLPFGARVTSFAKVRLR